MIAIDTNILVRYLVRDHPVQAEAARVLLESLTCAGPGYVPREVTVELVWVLERAYGFSRAQIATVLEQLVGSDGLVVEEAADVARAAERYRRCGAGFADHMIVLAAERAGALPLHTFNRKLAERPGAVLV